MGSTSLRIVLASVVALVFVLALLLWRASDTDAPQMPGLARDDVGAEGARALEPVPADPAPAVDGGSARVEATVTDDAGQPIVPGTYVFDVTFAPVDTLGRPLAGVAIDLGLLRHRANRMGTSGKDGELRITWRGNEPTMDAVVSATHAARSTLLHAVRLVGGTPCTVRFCAERMQAPMRVGNEVVGNELAGAGAPRKPASFTAPAFEIDAAGNGVFTDPDLLVRKIEPLPSSMYGRGTAFTTRKVSSSSKRVIADGKRKQVLDCFVHDAGGGAASGAPLRVLRAEWSRGEDERTDAEGRFHLLMPLTGSVDLEVGGGLFALQRRTFEAGRDDHAWNVQLQTLPTVRGRLTDAEGVPLPSWRIQARSDQPPHAYQHASVTDSSGAFEIGVACGGTVRLLASPGEGDDIPAQRILENVTAGAEPVELFVRSPQARVSALWHFDVPDGFAGAPPQARAMRRDSGEGMLLEPCDAGEGFQGRRRFAFCLEHVLPGRYTLTNLAPGGSSVFGASLGTQREQIGDIPLDGNMRIVLASDREDPELWTVRASTRSQGVQLRSEVLTVPGTLLAPAGDLRLELFSTADGRSGGIVRDISGTSGQRIEIRLDELR